ncbi:MAG: DUF423 domain-containing protein [Phycisphaeraceae bacterium]|nr:DUF423 domain-containing protein [Phycisphaeraceae bacterium]
MTRTFFILGSVFGMTAILAGTFGAHGLEQTVTPALLETFDTGVRYHMYHALALIGVAWACEHFGGKLPVAAGWLFVIGIIVFAGSLYLLAITGARWLGMITPIGGVAFVVGWLLLIVAGAQSRR